MQTLVCRVFALLASPWNIRSEFFAFLLLFMLYAVLIPIIGLPFSRIG